MQRAQKQSAFTMLEIAIVLAIIGLLAGGVLVGREMIHSAQLNKTLKQMRDIDQATTIFRDQYGGYPGDIRNASSYWPTAANGNGNGIIETAAPACLSNLSCHNFTGERAQFFTQLGLAGLITAYDGTTMTPPGVGYPNIPVNAGAGMIVGSTWTDAAASNMKMENYLSQSIHLYLGVCNPSQLNVAAAFNQCGSLVPIDAQNIDSKIDDGSPLSGLILGQSYNTICAMGTAANTTSVTATNSYNTAPDVPGCNLIFDLAQ